MRAWQCVPWGTDGWNAMGGAKNPFFFHSKKMATRALEVVV